ncbi:MAG: MFS transporter [Micrococcales bacterium]|nr:MFS transporter [Micrococcales bacterium]MCL2667445.1 MFS transporter [Micrococcales bacterium]
MTSTVPAGSNPHELTDWNPEDPERWNSSLAWSTLWTTTFSLILGFMVWYLPSALAPLMSGAGMLGTGETATSRSYWLVAMPGLAGGALRLLWMVFPPIFGTRKMVIWSTVALMAPMAGWAWVLLGSETGVVANFPLLMVLAFLTGIGGGVFSGYMPSTSYFFPKAKQGVALGLQAGIGNLGVAVVQLGTPMVATMALLGAAAVKNQDKINKATAANDALKPGEDPVPVPGPLEVHLTNAPVVLIVLLMVALFAAFVVLKSVPIKSNIRQQFDIFSNKHTWFMTLEYILTFGIFSGLAGQFGVVLKDLYSAPPTVDWIYGAPMIAFLGAFTGSVARILWGPLCDRFGGGIWTVVSGIGIAVSTLPVLLALRSDAHFTEEQAAAAQAAGNAAAEAGGTIKDSVPLGLFLLGMFCIFFFAGVGNASTFKQMPMIFPPRQAGGVIGWTAALAAFGPFLFGVAFDTFTKTLVFSFVLAYALFCATLAWYYYARPAAEAKS